MRVCGQCLCERLEAAERHNNESPLRCVRVRASVYGHNQAANDQPHHMIINTRLCGVSRLPTQPSSCVPLTDSYART